MSSPGLGFCHVWKATRVTPIDVKCVRCLTQLTTHCDHNDLCTWLVCPNRDCDVRYLDVKRRLIQLKDHTVLAWTKDG